VSTSELQTQAAERPDDIEAVPVRHPWRWVAAVIVVIVVASLIRSAINDPNFQWSVVRHYLFNPRIMRGVVTTIWLTAVSMVIGILLGIVLAVMRQSPNKLISGFSWLYIWFFRGTPLLVQILFWSFIGALYKYIDLGVPFGGPAIIHAKANDLISITVAVILALGLNEAAYMAEIIRSGLLSVDRGQTLAAESIGMTDTLMMRRIVLPQALRVIVPPTGNQVIGMLKYTSLVSVVALPELLYSAQLIYTQTFQPIPLLLVASTWYLIVTTILMIAQSYLERHFGRGFAGGQARARTRRPKVQAGARLIELESK
jgi:polar amino acid transport system permease protein